VRKIIIIHRTPSDLSSDGREEYENWKAERADATNMKDFAKEQAELERQEIMRLEEILQEEDAKLEHQTKMNDRW
jgi:hypothetical protein